MWLALERRVARLGDRARARGLLGRDPWRFARPLAGPGDRHLALALDWLTRSRGQGPGLAPGGYTIGVGWQAPCPIATALSIKPLREDRQGKDRDAALDAAAALVQALEDPHASSAALAHAIVACGTLVADKPALADSIATWGRRLAQACTGPLPATGTFLAPPSVLALALHLSNMPIPDSVRSALATSPTQDSSWHALAVDTVARTELGRCARDVDALVRLQPLVDRALLEFERKKGLWRGGAASVWSCPGGAAAFALVWLQFGELTGDHRYLNAGLKMNEYLKDAQVAGVPPASARGALRGSDPIFLGEFAYEFPTWCTALLADALLAEERVMAGYGN
jgi:hypothetical protein